MIHDGYATSKLTILGLRNLACAVNDVGANPNVQPFFTRKPLSMFPDTLSYRHGRSSIKSRSCAPSMLRNISAGRSSSWTEMYSVRRPAMQSV